MDCAAHPETPAVGPCTACGKGLCSACATYEVDGAPCCEACGRAREADAHALASGLLALIGVGYLGALAVGILLFNARPFVGGLAAVVAIALGRAMQLLVHTPTVSRRVGITPAAGGSAQA